MEIVWTGVLGVRLWVIEGCGPPGSQSTTNLGLTGGVDEEVSFRSHNLEETVPIGSNSGADSRRVAVIGISARCGYSKETR